MSHKILNAEVFERYHKARAERKRLEALAAPHKAIEEQTGAEIVAAMQKAGVEQRRAGRFTAFLKVVFGRVSWKTECLKLADSETIARIEREAKGKTSVALELHEAE